MCFDDSQQACEAFLKDKDSGMALLIAAKHNIQMPDPGAYDGITKSNFEYNRINKSHESVTKYKDGSKQINALDIQTFLEHPLVDPIVTNPLPRSPQLTSC